MWEYLSVGKVLKPRGLKGELKVLPLSDVEKRFDDLEYVYVLKDDTYMEILIESRRYDKGYAYLKFKDYNDVNSAETFRNEYLWIPRIMVRELPKDTFYIADIIGCKVKTDIGKELGMITDIIKTGSNDVYVVDGELGEILVPALKKVVIDVDLLRKLITVDLTDMKGLLPNEN